MLNIYSDCESRTQAHAQNNLSAQPKRSVNNRIIQQAHSSLKATIYMDTIRGKPAVIKDYSDSHPFIRATLCKWFIHREIVALEKLKGLPGIPKVLGRCGPYGFSTELIEGKTLTKKLLKNNVDLIQQLDKSIKTLHKYGVTHNDIRNKNLLIDPYNNLHIIDFASAIIKPKHRYSFATFLYKLTRFTERVKVVRLKQELGAQTLTESDRPFLKFADSSKMISRFWKKYIYRFLKLS